MSGNGDISSERWKREGGSEAETMQSRTKKNNEPCVDPVETENYEIDSGIVQNICHKNAKEDATETEKVIFLPVQAKPSSSSCMCGPCASVKSCRAFMCSVLTCGLYYICVRLPCLLPCVMPRTEPE